MARSFRLSVSASRRRIRAVASRLAAAYGARGWWPTTPRGAREATYERRNPYRRKSDAEVLEIAVGAILTQNTAWTNAARALDGLRRAALLGASALRRATRKRIAQAIRSSGYYRAKARKLRALARWLATNPIHALRREPAAALRDRLLAVHGIGPETADSILCYALDRPAIVADAYTRRVFGRLGVQPRAAGYETTRALAESALPRVASADNEFHARIVELAKRHCLTKPRCPGCPLRPICPRIGVGSASPTSARPPSAPRHARLRRADRQRSRP